MSAGCAPRPASMCRSTQLSAKFIRPPWNHRGHGNPRETSRTCVYGRVKRSPRSLTTASQYQSGSATLRCWSSSSEPTPSERMKRDSRVRSAYSRVGRQTISLVPVSVIHSSREGSVLGRGLLGQRGGGLDRARDEPALVHDDPEEDELHDAEVRRDHRVEH